MGRNKSVFTQRAITRATKAVTKAGIVVERVEVDGDGKIVVVAANGTKTYMSDGKATTVPENEWDEIHGEKMGS